MSDRTALTLWRTLTAGEKVALRCFAAGSTSRKAPTPFAVEQVQRRGLLTHGPTPELTGLGEFVWAAAPAWDRL